VDAVRKTDGDEVGEPDRLEQLRNEQLAFLRPMKERSASVLQQLTQRSKLPGQQRK
jgi:hypothetical protein